MTDFASRLLFILGLAAAALAILDWALSSAQKKLITDWCASAWVRLNDWRATTYFDMLRTKWGARLTSMLAGVASLYFIYHVLQETAGRQLPNLFQYSTIGVGLSGVLMAFWVHPYYVQKNLEIASLNDSVARFGLAGLMLFVGALIVSLLLVQFELASLAWIIYSTLGGAGFFYLVVFILWISWLVYVIMAVPIVRGIEFLMLKLAEYEKGPIAGASVLLITVSQVIGEFE